MNACEKCQSQANVLFYSVNYGYRFFSRFYFKDFWGDSKTNYRILGLVGANICNKCAGKEKTRIIFQPFVLLLISQIIFWILSLVFFKNPILGFSPFTWVSHNDGYITIHLGIWNFDINDWVTAILWCSAALNAMILWPIYFTIGIYYNITGEAIEILACKLKRPDVYSEIRNLKKSLNENYSKFDVYYWTSKRFKKLEKG